MSNADEEGTDYLVHISHPAREVLANCKRAMEARKDGSERREGSEEFEPEAKGWEETSQTSGIRERITERGLEIGGGPLDLGCNSFSFEASEDASGPDAGSIHGTDRGEHECSLPRVFDEFDLRAVPRRARLDGGVSLLSSSRLHIACNDNRHAGSTSRAATVQLWQV